MKLRANNTVSTDKVNGSSRSAIYGGLISFAIFAALVIAPTPAEAGSDFSFGFHVNDGYYNGSSIFFGFGPQVFLPYGYFVYDNSYYDSPYRSYRGYGRGYGRGHGYGQFRGYGHGDRYEGRHNRGHGRDNNRRDNHRRGNRHGRR